jgi:hypothetical protein
VWQDQRNGNWDIYIQKVDVNGDVEWAANGVAVCSNAHNQQFYQQAVTDGSGGAIIAWSDRRSGNLDVYAQRIGSTGAVLWAEGGVPVCTHAADDWYPEIVPDGSGGALVAWQNGQGSEGKVYVQRLSPDGGGLWGGEGVAVCNTTGQNLPRVSPDGAGGAVVVWIDGPAGDNDIYAQRVDAGGNRLWGPHGVVVCSLCEVWSFVQVEPDGEGGVILAWHDFRSGNNDIYAQRMDGSGYLLWTPGGVSLCSLPEDQWIPQIYADGYGGGFFTWVDLRGGEPDIYAQRVDASGAVQWAEGGLSVCSADSQQINPRILSDTEGGVIIAWQDRRSGDYDVYAQRLDPAGAALWQQNGVAVCVASGEQRLPEIAPDGAGGALIAWENWDGEPDVYCRRINAAGDFVATTLQSYAASWSEGCVTVTWRIVGSGDGASFTVMRKSSAEDEFTNLPGECSSDHPASFHYVDHDVEPGETYVYRVDVQDEDGGRILFETQPLTVPQAPVTLYQNFPNPFNPSTTIRFYIPQRTRAVLEIFDAAGRSVARLFDEERAEGWYAVEWSGRDRNGGAVRSGVYFYRLTTGKVSRSRKLVMVR